MSLATTCTGFAALRSHGRFRTRLDGCVLLTSAVSELIEDRVHDFRGEENFAVGNGNRGILPHRTVE